MTASEELIHQRLSSFSKWWDLHEQLRDLILKMLKVDPAERISSHGVLHHPWVTMFRNQNL